MIWRGSGSGRGRGGECSGSGSDDPWPLVPGEEGEDQWAGSVARLEVSRSPGHQHSPANFPASGEVARVVTVIVCASAAGVTMAPVSPSVAAIWFGGPGPSSVEQGRGLQTMHSQESHADTWPPSLGVRRAE